MTQVIRPEASYLKKIMKSNSQSIKYWKMKFKKKFNFIRGLQKQQLKKWRSKFKYQISFIFDLRVKLKRKINLAKGPIKSNN
jgi:hypothetical protein